MHILARTSDKKIIPVTVDDDGHLQVDLLAITAGDNLIGRVDARDGDKIWSFAGIVDEAVTDLDLSTGLNTLNGTPVPPGEIWCITLLNFQQVGTSPSDVSLQFRNLAGGITYIVILTPPSYKHYSYPMTTYMYEGNYVRAYIQGATAGADAYLKYCGWKMQI